MRLRQAHAMFEAAAAVEALGLGFKFEPLDRDDWRFADPDFCAEDFLMAETEIEPDSPTKYELYEVRLLPGPREFDITVQLSPNSRRQDLLDDVVRVWSGYPDDEDERYFDTGGCGERIAQMVADAISKNQAARGA